MGYSWSDSDTEVKAMFYRMYNGESVGESVSEDEARDKLSRYYNNVDEIIADMRSGIVIYTPWARYWWEKAENHV